MTAIETHRASRPGYPAMAVHRFTVSSELPRWSRRYDVAACGPYRATSLKSCAARKLARDMIDAGEPDGPIEARGTDGKLRYTVRSLYAFAKTTLSEDPRLRAVPYREWGRTHERNAVSDGSDDCPATSGPETGVEAVQEAV